MIFLILQDRTWTRWISFTLNPFTGSTTDTTSRYPFLFLSIFVFLRLLLKILGDLIKIRYTTESVVTRFKFCSGMLGSCCKSLLRPLFLWNWGEIGEFFLKRKTKRGLSNSSAFYFVNSSRLNGYNNINDQSVSYPDSSLRRRRFGTLLFVTFISFLNRC